MKTVHHLFPKNAVDWRWRDTQINKKLIDHTKHVNHHRVFWNFEFHNQILQVLDFNAQILQEKVIREVSEIVCQDLEYIYKNGVFIPKY
jgi:hypothetical protein